MLEEKSQHKHTEITLQNNCKWDEHISNLSGTVGMLINCLRNFKHKLSRKAFETYLINLSYFHSLTMLILPGATVPSFNPLHLKIYSLKPRELSLALSSEQATENCITSPDSVHERKDATDTNWSSFIKIVNNACPDYLSDLLPPLAPTTNPYHRRRPNERITAYLLFELNYTVILFPHLLLSCGIICRSIFKKVLL